jgi:hypothetical protein
VCAGGKYKFEKVPPNAHLAKTGTKEIYWFCGCHKIPQKSKTQKNGRGMAPIFSIH